LQRAFDQVFHDVCFMEQPILMLGYRSGFAGYDNPTHHGIYDYSYLRGMPNLKILYPKDRHEAARMVRDELLSLSGPVLILMPYGPVQDFDASVLKESRESFQAPQLVQAGKDMLITAVGNKFAAAEFAMKQLRADGVNAGLMNLRQLKPLVEKELLKQFEGVRRLVTVEEYVCDGGVGGAITEFVCDHGLDCEVLRIALPTAFIEPGSNDELEEKYGLNGPGVLRQIKDRWSDI